MGAAFHNALRGCHALPPTAARLESHKEADASEPDFKDQVFREELW